MPDSPDDRPRPSDTLLLWLILAFQIGITILLLTAPKPKQPVLPGPPSSYIYP